VKNPGIVKRKKRKIFPRVDEIVFVNVNPPVKCSLKYSKRRFTVHMKYYMKNDPLKKVKSKKINFGNPKHLDFIDHKDKVKREIEMSKLRSYSSPFKPNFWRVYLLNTFPDIMTAYMHFLKFNDLCVF